jgi:hypothetical protein
MPSPKEYPDNGQDRFGLSAVRGWCLTGQSFHFMTGADHAAHKDWKTRHGGVEAVAESPGL